MMVYITKYALTQGVYAIDGEADRHRPKLFVRTKVSGGPPEYYQKPYWHEHKADAMRHANDLRLRRIATLKKQMTKLEGLNFRP